MKRRIRKKMESYFKIYDDVYCKKIVLIPIIILITYLSVLCAAYADNVPNQIIDNENSIYLTELDYSLKTNSFLIDESLGSKAPENILDKNLGVIYKIQAPKNISTIRDKKDFIYNLRLSPDNKSISFFQKDVYGSNETKIILFDRQSKNEKVLIKDNILEYKWSPDGNKIVYITGQYDKPDGPTITGIWIYLIENDSKFRFAASALTVEWYQDDFIYLIDTKILRAEKKIKRKTKKYYLKNRKMDQEELEGFKYSPDDKYYLRLSDDNLITSFQNPWDFHKLIVFDICDCKTMICPSREKSKNIFAKPEDINWEKTI